MKLHVSAPASRILLALSVAAALFVATLPLLLPPHFGASLFPDVDPAHPYAPAISDMQDRGIVGGYEDGSFRPNQLVTRAELVKLVIGPIRHPDKLIRCADETAGPLFTDVPDARAVWYGPYLCEAQRSGIIGGYSDGSFQPEREVSAAETARIVSTAYDLPPTHDVSSDPWFRPFMYALNERYVMPPSIVMPEQSMTRAELSEMLSRIIGRFESDPAAPRIFPQPGAHPGAAMEPQGNPEETPQESPQEGA